ncbi:flagellar biosynthesis protein FlhB [Saccharophagus degradans]|uniref:Flagellar biosynthetic protein FlhB n=1 Tax=Saccharophagus degradans TaxID=86304 RepID=A0AAW7WZW3_9GAMM|nr:flagellar biosynthesis protein FlhB [Saccharophagus degradans]MBU2985829.1 flagellar biosynthesis protein FlhB [Saccharophagus degradans]MDO6421020.1 flagellar biosynthesis protein FlhB [Saccharophagus degradans]MDO6606069.1 flagellar biosynthesis protein FlhB [Saccharophagus degradans]
MAEEDSAQEKTEEPTAKRQEKAREDGQIPRSKELTTSAVLIVGCVGLYMFGGQIAQGLADILKFNFTIEREAIFDPNAMLGHLGSSFYLGLKVLIPLFAVLLVAAIAGPIALGGWLFSTKSLAPKLNRMDPVAGLKRMFSVKSLVELVKAIGKVGVVVAFAFVLLNYMKEDLLGLGFEGVERGMAHSVYLSIIAAIIISVSTLVIAAVDIPFQIWDNVKKLRMTRQEIKDEMKDSEGKPEVKGRIRQLQYEMAQNRMMAAVPEADVVITNPTHYSVALKYDPNSMETPILLAKGVDHMAMKIREIAKVNKIEFIQSPLLARAIYHTTEVDEEIPSGLYVAVAQVLAYVFQIREYRRGRGERPTYPRNPPVPKDMRY